MQVVKSNNSVAQEYCALQLARELEVATEPRAAALRVPDVRLVCWQDPKEPHADDECLRLHKSMLRYSSINDRLFIERQLNRPVLMMCVADSRNFTTKRVNLLTHVSHSCFFLLACHHSAWNLFVVATWALWRRQNSLLTSRRRFIRSVSAK